LLSKHRKYVAYLFTSEEEIEKEIIRHAREIFGQSTIYIDTRKRLSAKSFGVSTFPDGLLLDLTVADNALLYLVEIEWSRHDMKHVTSQLLSFEMVFEESRETIHEFLRKELEHDKERHALIQSTLKGSSTYKNLHDLTYQLIFKQTHEILLIADKISAAWMTAIEKLNFPVRPLELSTFVPDDSESPFEDCIHLIPSFREDIGEERAYDEEIWYRCYLNEITTPDIPKQTFFEKHGLTLFQAFAYTRDSDGKITGLVFQGYRNRIDRDLSGSRDQIWWGTRAPIKIDNLYVGMPVYVVETEYDVDQHKRVENPKVRIQGKLREVYRVRGAQRQLLFPQPASSL